MAQTQTSSVAEVLRPRLLSIPDYQRGYAWEQQHVAEFLSDLTLLEDGRQHYTGTLVFLPNQVKGIVVDDVSNSLQHVDVVDGQQRLTTVCLLLNEIRLALVQAGESVAAAGLRQQYLATSLKGQVQYKIQVGSDAAEMWSALVDDKSLPISRSLSGERMRAAAEQIRSFFQNIVSESENSVAALFEVRDKTLTQLRFNVYDVDEQADVGVIFETLNDRGKPLTELEKAKNYLLFLAARLSAGQQRQLAGTINTAWATIYRLLLESARISAADEDRFVRAHWLAAVDPKATNWRGTKSLKDHFPREKYLGQPDLIMSDVTAYVESLARAAHAFADTVRPGVQAFASFGPTASAVSQAQERLNRTNNVAVFQPLLIAVRERYPDDGQLYFDVVDLCERFAVRTYLIQEYRSDAGQGRLYRLAHSIYTGAHDHATIDRDLRRLVHSFAPDSAVSNALRDTEANWYRWSGLIFFLYEYELHLLKGGKPDLGYADFGKSRLAKTVEHILPQTATSGYWTSRFRKRNRAELTHALGNLVLTRDNSAYSNKDFPAKRGAAGPGTPQIRCYAQSPIMQEQELASIADWTPEQILQRQGRLADWALQRWSVNFTDFDTDADAADDVAIDLTDSAEETT